MKPMNLPREQPEDVNSLLTIKLALKYANMREVESMHAIAHAHQGKNLVDFEKALRDDRNTKNPGVAGATARDRVNLHI